MCYTTYNKCNTHRSTTYPAESSISIHEIVLVIKFYKTHNTVEIEQKFKP